jgi:hypothetical protein
MSSNLILFLCWKAHDCIASPTLLILFDKCNELNCFRSDWFYTSLNTKIHKPRKCHRAASGLSLRGFYLLWKRRPIFFCILYHGGSIKGAIILSLEAAFREQHSTSILDILYITKSTENTQEKSSRKSFLPFFCKNARRIFFLLLFIIISSLILKKWINQDAFN